MAINLVKGETIGVASSLTQVAVGLGWDPNDGSGHDFDLDASAFMLGNGGHLLADEYLVFYNNQESPDGSVKSSGDDLTGGNSEEGDDETLFVDLTKVNPLVQEILFTATIYKAADRKQNFGQVSNAYIRLYNMLNDEEIARFDLGEDFSVETAVEFARLYRYQGGWKFKALGLGNKNGLEGLVAKYQ